MRASRGVYVPDHRLSWCELQSAALDGELVALGDGFLPIDSPATPHARAASLAPVVLDDRVIVSDRSAAWVWGWGARPLSLTTCVSITARIASPERRRMRAREVVIDAHERVSLGGVALTSPLRTLVDLARHDAGDDLDALLVQGIRTHGVDAHDIASALSGRTNLSFVRTARARLERALTSAAL